MSFLKTKYIFDLTRRALGTSKTVQAAWNKDWMPGQYPLTDEERKAAAKKYGLMDVEYKPINDDGSGAGDYPDFKPYSTTSRDSFYPWDYPEYKRNFNESMHQDFFMYTEDRVDINQRQRFKDWQMVASFLGAMGLSGLLIYLGKDLFFIPKMPPHLPGEGVKHYKYPGEIKHSH